MTYLNPVFMNMLLDAAEEPGLFSPEQLGGYAVTFILAICNVVVAYLVIKFLLFKPIMGIISKRQALIDASVDDAKKVAEDAKNSSEESKKTIEAARIQASEIIESSKVNADKQSEIIIAKANSDASAIIARAENDAKRIKKAALEEMKDEISDLSVVIAQKILGDVIAEDKLNSLATKYTKEVLDDEVNKLG